MSKKTLIIYQGGHHGNFLRYIGNTAWHKRPIKSPFRSTGISHGAENVKSLDDRFHTNHWFSAYSGSQSPDIDEHGYDWGMEKVVHKEWFDPMWEFIVITASTTCMFEMVWLMFNRLPNNKIDIDNLTENTKEKILNYSENLEWYDLLCNSYNINSGDDIPRHVLRESLKFQFIDSEVSSQMKHDKDFKQMLSDAGIKYFNFPLEAFYNTSLFKETLTDLSKFTDCEFDLVRLEELHLEFLAGLQTMFDLKNQADEIISNVLSNVSSDIPNLDLLQESYINGTLEKITGVEMPFDRPKEYFTSTKQIIDHIEYARSEIS